MNCNACGSHMIHAPKGAKFCARCASRRHAGEPVAADIPRFSAEMSRHTQQLWERETEWRTLAREVLALPNVPESIRSRLEEMRQ